LHTKGLAKVGKPLLRSKAFILEKLKVLVFKTSATSLAVSLCLCVDYPAARLGTLLQPHNLAGAQHAPRTTAEIADCHEEARLTQQQALVRKESSSPTGRSPLARFSSASPPMNARLRQYT
jgi:hypothetical protein